MKGTRHSKNPETLARFLGLTIVGDEIISHNGQGNSGQLTWPKVSRRHDTNIKGVAIVYEDCYGWTLAYIGRDIIMSDSIKKLFNKLNSFDEIADHARSNRQWPRAW